MIAFQPKQKILFIGDSITECNRFGSAPPLGDGYVSMIYNFLTARYPELALNVVNKGVSGNTTRDLKSRWRRDVLQENPDWLSVGIGINDVWRYFGGNLKEAVPLDEYESILRNVLDQTAASTKARLIIMEPYIIEASSSDPMRQEMDRYRACLAQIAADYRAILVPTQTAFDNALHHTTSQQWADDRIHPYGPGHMLIALAFLKAVGADI